jgi:5'-methylthioadenosine phosphorylase/purine-nucleoside phosphorylase
MEAAMLYTIAAVKGVEALAVMTVSDILSDTGKSERISDDELKRGVDSMMRLACRLVVS